MQLPFEGAISRFFETEAPQPVRAAIRQSAARDILNPDYPYATTMKRKAYERDLAALQIELVKMQHRVVSTGGRVAIVFEGRDASGKGGTIKRLRANLNPRVARIVALSKPSDHERSQWYFQRYIAQLPAAGEIAIFDRSWYNRAVIEHVFGFCTQDERKRFFDQASGFEKMLVDDGITLVKIWLNVGRAEQLRRFLEREDNPLKQWKLSRIDIEGLSRWGAYTDAISETFAHTHTPHAPWTVIRSDCKKRARLAALRQILTAVRLEGENAPVIAAPDPKICAGPEIWRDNRNG